MHPLLDDSGRQLIPRWRTSRITMSLGELASISIAPDRALNQSDVLDQKIDDWRRERSLSFASDLLASAIITGEVADAREAAEFVLSPNARATEAAKTVARRVISPLSFDNFSLHVGDANREYHRAAIRLSRARTRNDPRHA